MKIEINGEFARTLICRRWLRAATTDIKRHSLNLGQHFFSFIPSSLCCPLFSPMRCLQAIYHLADTMESLFISFASFMPNVLSFSRCRNTRDVLCLRRCDAYKGFADAIKSHLISFAYVGQPLTSVALFSLHWANRLFSAEKIFCRINCG